MPTSVMGTSCVNLMFWGRRSRQHGYNEFAKTLDCLGRNQFTLYWTKYNLLRDFSSQMKTHRACRLESPSQHVGIAKCAQGSVYCRNRQED